MNRLAKAAFYAAWTLVMYASLHRIAVGSPAPTLTWPGGSCAIDSAAYRPPHVVVSGCGTVYAIAPAGVTYSDALVLASPSVPSVDRVFKGSFQ